MFDHGAHLLSIRSSKLKAELDNDDGGGAAESEVGQDIRLLEVAGGRQQRGAHQSGQHLGKRNAKKS